MDDRFHLSKIICSTVSVIQQNIVKEQIATLTKQRTDDIAQTKWADNPILLILY